MHYCYQGSLCQLSFLTLLTFLCFYYRQARQTWIHRDLYYSDQDCLIPLRKLVSSRKAHSGRFLGDFENPATAEKPTHFCCRIQSRQVQRQRHLKG